MHVGGVNLRRVKYLVSRRSLVDGRSIYNIRMRIAHTFMNWGKLRIQAQINMKKMLGNSLWKKFCGGCISTF